MNHATRLSVEILKVLHRVISYTYLSVDGGVGLAAVQLGRVAVAGRAVVGRGQERQRRQEDQVLKSIRNT